jgi:hypothetical protein
MHHMEKIERMEWELKFTLVAVVGGSRLAVTLLQVKECLHDQFGLPANSVHIKRFFTKDFLTFFSYYDDMLHVHHCNTSCL